MPENTTPSDNQSNLTPDTSFDYPDRIDYDAYQIPRLQILYFFVNGYPNSATNVNYQTTADEWNSVVVNNNDYLNGKGRILQTVPIIQGDAQSYKIKLCFVNNSTGQPQDMTGDSIILFDGQPANGYLPPLSDGFDTTQAKNGIIYWSPPEEVGWNAGYFKNARFLIESTDRTQRYSTLQFGVDVIPSDVPEPDRTKPPMSEYHKVLMQTFDFARVVNGHINYLELYANRRADLIAKSAQNVINADVKAAENTLKNLISSQTTQLDSLNKQIKSANDSVKSTNDSLSKLKNDESTFETTINSKTDNWMQQLNGKDLVTKDQIQALVEEAIRDMDKYGTIMLNNKITDADKKAKLEQMLKNGGKNG